MPTPEIDLNMYHDRLDAESRADAAYQAQRVESIEDADAVEILDALTDLEQGIRTAEAELLKLAVIFDRKEFDSVGVLIDNALDALMVGVDDAAERLGDDAWDAVENPERYIP